MLDGWLKPKFYSKCKTALKLTKTRVEAVKRRRNAVEKYLQKDIVDLLKNGFDYNAYGRAEGLLIEQNMSFCYGLVEQFCASVSSCLSAMQKEKECPEECREAVPSLMFAAARFADLPELRELRSLFSEKYGNSLENFANKEFVGRLKAGPPSKDMKLRLMKDLVVEYSIEWDSKALEQKLFTPPPASPLSTIGTTEPSQEVAAGGETCPSRTKRDQRRPDFLHEDEQKRHESVKSSVGGDDRVVHEDGPAREARPKPRSVRQRKQMPQPGPEAADETTSRANLRNGKVNDDKDKDDEEEKVIDGLLIHYSLKESSPYDQLKQLPLKDIKPAEFGSHPARAASQLSEKPADSLKRERTRGHVHPNLPDCDDLASRIADLRGK
ncbi:hypothetical protein SAY87_002406 [Trapa incisa]|uniref:IST1-like protein n=1 Tax=Trapa incisa TaxID=236973 RepID=A0AAN7JWQ3_9MYRT|nr:hypothetical protein SAY87_002406 [Trapa incisa]